MHLRVCAACRLALSPVGQQQDVDTIALRYSEEWWLHQLAARNLSAIWLRSKYPHNYEITAIEAYMDLYQLTAEPKYLAAVDGFYAMFREHWMHVGGTVAIKEWKLYPPGSYFLDTWVCPVDASCFAASRLTEKTNHFDCQNLRYCQ